MAITGIDDGAPAAGVRLGRPEGARDRLPAVGGAAREGLPGTEIMDRDRPDGDKGSWIRVSALPPSVNIIASRATRKTPRQASSTSNTMITVLLMEAPVASPSCAATFVPAAVAAEETSDETKATGWECSPR
mmetsp:Transcript_135284/g.337543  ORF Transcript_135284/g.337543 Transcript_135284/m.337543 type:complete len:132 (+) Transcript_135284:194-589(+)